MAAMRLTSFSDMQERSIGSFMMSFRFDATFSMHISCGGQRITRMYVCMYVCMYGCICISIVLYAYILRGTKNNTYVCMYVCLCISIVLYIYTYTHIHTYIRVILCPPQDIVAEISISKLY